MPENFNEISKAQETPDKQLPVEKGDYSSFRDQYLVEKKKIIELNRTIKQMEEIIDREKNSDKADKIEVGLQELKKQRKAAMDQASVALGNHLISTRELQKMDKDNPTH